jgi:hypothetical protein
MRRGATLWIESKNSCDEAGERRRLTCIRREIPCPACPPPILKPKPASHSRDPDKTARTDERACWLAEELGHHYTGSDRRLHYTAADDWRAEAKARKWAHDRLLSPEAIRTAARNTDDIYEIAFTLNVSVEFLRESIDWYMARGLWTPDTPPEEPPLDVLNLNDRID